MNITIGKFTLAIYTMFSSSFSSLFCCSFAQVKLPPKKKEIKRGKTKNSMVEIGVNLYFGFRFPFFLSFLFFSPIFVSFDSHLPEMLPNKRPVDSERCRVWLHHSSYSTQRITVFLLSLSLFLGVLLKFEL